MNDIKCKNAIRNTGAKKPKCNGGAGCELCNCKHGLQEVARVLGRPLFDLRNKDELHVDRVYRDLFYASFLVMGGE